MFTSYPDSYQSLYSQLVYSYKKESEGDITLFVTDSTTDEILGVKKFYSTSTAELNIAPIVRAEAYPYPELLQSGFIEQHNACSIEVTVADAEQTFSSTRTFTLSREEEEGVGLVTSFDQSDRLIAMGEGEWLMLRVDPEQPIEVEIHQYSYGVDSAVATRLYELGAQSSGLAIFGVVAESMAQSNAGLNMDRFEVVATQGDEVIAQVGYSVINDYEESVRLAWLSSRGSLEHYTFPVVSQRTALPNRVVALGLSSAYESLATRAAIGQIVDSPLVWMVVDGLYRAVELVSREVELDARRELAVVDLKISYTNE